MEPFSWTAFFVYVAISTVVSAASYLLQRKPPRPDTPKPATLDQFDVPTAEEGRSIPVVFGTVWHESPNVVWYGDLRTEAVKEKSGKSRGGK